MAYKLLIYPPIPHLRGVPGCVEVPREKFTFFRIMLNGFVDRKHPDYIANLGLWNYLDDLYFGSDRWLELANDGFKPTDRTNLFLPRHTVETYENWVNRINHSHYDDLFGKALRQFIDLIFKNPIKFSVEGSDFEQHYQSLGNRGAYGSVFLRNAALSALRLGHCFIFLDYPVVNASTYKEYQEISPRPYWSLIENQNLIDWECEFIANRLVFTLAVIKEQVLGIDGDNYQMIDQYRVYRPGSFEIWRGNEKEGYFVYSSGEIVSGYPYVPICPVFGGLRTGDCTSVPPLRTLADKNRALYQMMSDHNRKVSLCCQPVPVLKDSMRGDEPLEIGPNSFINIRDPNGSFGWSEPLALSLQQSRVDISDLRESIAYDAANYLTSPSDRQTSSTTQLLTVPLEASLGSFVSTFSDGVNECIRIHNQMIDCNCDTQIIFDSKLLSTSDTPKKEQLAIAIQSLFSSGVITRHTTLKALDRLQIFDDKLLEDEVLNSPNGFFGDGK